jgi:hypothetical protein
VTLIVNVTARGKTIITNEASAEAETPDPNSNNNHAAVLRARPPFKTSRCLREQIKPDQSLWLQALTPKTSGTWLHCFALRSGIPWRATSVGRPSVAALPFIAG